MITIDQRLYAPATQRNRDPILDVLRSHLPTPSRVLEIASGTGEHAIYLSEHLEQVTLWQPTDIESSSLKSIEAWREHYPDSKVLRSKYLDVTAKDNHPELSFDVIVAINLIHITPWQTTECLMKYASDHLPKGGLLYLYGPFWQSGVEPAESNLHFDATLKRQHSDWGIRQLNEVIEEARKHGFTEKAIIPMPANNLSIILQH